MNAARDIHLRKAVLRALHRPLSTLLSTVSAQLLVLLSSPAFLSPAVPTPQAPHPNPTQMHALGYATLAGELLDTFDDLRLGIDTDSRADGLKPIRDGLTALVNRVINPLAAGIVDDLMRLIAALEFAPAPNGPPSNSASKVSLTDLTNQKIILTKPAHSGLSHGSPFTQLFRSPHISQALFIGATRRVIHGLKVSFSI